MGPYEALLVGTDNRSVWRNMQDPIDGPSLHRQASDVILDRKLAEGNYQPEPSSAPAAPPLNLPAYYDLDKKYTASSPEIWSYYMYLVANSGATLSNFAPTAFQNLLSQAAGDAGVLPFAGK